MNATEKHTNDVAETLKSLIDGKEAYFPERLCANYPKIVEKICLLWREPNPKLLHNYFTELLTTDRVKRDGFPPEIHHEIFTLSNYYATLHPIPRFGDDFWNGVDTR